MTYATYPSLAGRVAFVTGGASGIGADIVRAFAANQSKVAFVDIQDDAGNALAKETGGLFIKADLTDIESLKSAIAKTRETLGPVGILVNNAANDDRHKIDEVTVEYWDHALDVNLRHQFFAAQAVRPHMKELGKGAIINFSSIAWKGGEVFPAYAAAKAGVLGLTRALSRAFGPDNIRVNAIEPGAVITERQLRLWYGSEQDVENVVSRQAIRRKLVGADIARVVLFLASDDSEMIDRQSIIVDGGLT
jgi:NAD(P)-dependent dehydrogenase (short-subunit alcohol dehydrogenase family)